jgi:hypothetical protein
MNRAGHQFGGYEAPGPIVPRGQGYQENDLTKCPPMDPEAAAEFVRLRRAQECAMMAERAEEIDQGLVHETYAAICSKQL